MPGTTYTIAMLAKKIRSMGYAMKGLWIAFKEEHNFRFELMAALIAVALGWYLKISPLEWLFIVVAIGLVLTAEVFNTALEELCDMLRQTHDPHVAKIKDLSAAAVFLVAITALIIGCSIFIPHLI